jgi:hypothetical protein
VKWENMGLAAPQPPLGLDQRPLSQTIPPSLKRVEGTGILSKAPLTSLAPRALARSLFWTV